MPTHRTEFEFGFNRLNVEDQKELIDTIGTFNDIMCELIPEDAVFLSLETDGNGWFLVVSKHE